MARRFSYEGDHAEVTLYGVTFPQGEPVPVDNPVLLKKLEGNNHFREHADAVPAPDAAMPADPAEPIPAAHGQSAPKRKYTRRKEA
jgi:hypothetical protein